MGSERNGFCFPDSGFFNHHQVGRGLVVDENISVACDAQNRSGGQLNVA